ncbi:CheW protein [Jatrophihabitans sp. GAS493]|uniref:chemotaxis protein CheW n=1 Tax=Jatrophihabitans sp. GAS493 TaxID=1907575 RepID=UPI000BB7FCCB|nr:chemotaxis protein CheW [Jatrophihabitans sp. GAS493]SOD74516.1 CheW protein [Jatrophihabitans sp. GAS493]
MATLLATFHLGDYLCAVPVGEVQEVLMEQTRTPAPGASKYVTGLINLRGQVVTALDLRLRMGVATTVEQRPSMNVVVCFRNEVWSLLVDSIGDVIEVEESQFEAPPETLHGALRELITGAYKLDGRLLLVLNVERALDVSTEPAAA